VSEVVLRNYLRKIEKVYQTGNATEHTYRSALQELLETLFPGISATNEPKRIKCGAPDFIITNKQTPLGYIETKDIGISLDQIERTDQMKRYLGSLANLILTDYLEFRWYVSGQHRMTVRLAKVGANHKLLPENEGVEKLADLLQGFVLTQTPTVSNPKELAIRMAALAQLIRNAIRMAFESEEGGGSLHTQMEGFKQVLLPDLTYEQFADMYAQTISYGLFAARCNTKPGAIFTREHASYDIPKTNPFLRKMFGHIAGPDLDERIVWAVDDLAELLNRSDMHAILQDFGKRTRQEDPVVHFYETFLAQYDPKLRELRGVYYTPEPVVSYIVHSVDYLLKKDFDLAGGLADATKLKAVSADGTFSLETHKVQILDPATGTGTFLYSIIDHIYALFKGNQGMWSSYVSQHLLPRLFGFELLMAPYAVAHMKLGLQLAETGYDFRSNERLGIYLTNALKEGFEGERLPFVEWLVEEATAAGNIKHDAPVMVVLGNPPYSGHSANKGEWITKLIEAYKEGCPELKKPAQAKWLSDDYVKFIRFAQWRIERTGYGILAFITNHSYLDNPTFRCMRQSLMQSFDDIYILDLHGNSKKKEQAADGTKDENVFDIQQGVAIGLFVKWKGASHTPHLASVQHANVWGLREVYQPNGQGQTTLTGGKYHWLAEQSVASTSWQTLSPQAPFYLLAPQDTQNLAEYEKGWKVPDIFRPNGDPAPGIVTTQDEFAISWTKAEAIRKVERLLATETEAEARQLFRLCAQDQWQYAWAKKELAHGQWRQELVEVLYRPFDVRWTVFNRHVAVHRRERVMRHMLAGQNLGITIGRAGQVIDQGEWDIVFCSRFITEYNLYRRGGNNLFPIYLYPDTSKTTLFDTELHTDVQGGRRPNLASTFLTDCSRRLGLEFIPDGKGDLYKTFGPEDIVHYMYAIFYSSSYRKRYVAFLKIDFPRLPLTSNPNLFRALCERGERLVRLHLMEQFGKALPAYPVEGNNIVEKIEYVEIQDQPEQGRVYINKVQCFDCIPSEVWEFHIGGYQVCEKWLKDRKGRTLLYEDIQHYQRMVAALAETITLMEKIDETIEEHGGWPIE
jgi:predicted helicase